MSIFQKWDICLTAESYPPREASQYFETIRETLEAVPQMCDLEIGYLFIPNVILIRLTRPLGKSFANPVWQGGVI